MKMAKASEEEWQALTAWFNAREEKNEPVPQWRRVVFGYRVLVNNCADPNLDVLDFNPRIKAALKAAPEPVMAKPDTGCPATGCLASTLLECSDCGQKPNLVEQELTTGMDATIECPCGCNTVSGPLHWAIYEWNRQMREE